jgi:hypothetical protein
MAKKLRANGNGSHAPAPKKRKKNEPVAMPAVTEEQKQAALERLHDAAKARKDAKAKFDSVHGSYRKAFDEFVKLSGHSKKAVSWYMVRREQEPHEVDAEMRDIARIASWTKMASGFQAAFNFDALTNAPVDDIEAAKDQGRKAARSPKPEQNPYPDDDPRNVAWQGAYLAEQAQAVEGMRAQ